MWELRTCGRVIYGSEIVKTWPVITRSNQIPAWEAIRLIANRICELLISFGEFSKLHELSNNKVTSLQYSCLKLILACSEAQLIKHHIYRAYYQERFKQHFCVSNCFTQVQNRLIYDAYHTRLGLNTKFFDIEYRERIIESIQLGLTTLEQFGIKKPSDINYRALKEKSSNEQILSDLYFFTTEICHGRIVPLRRPIGGMFAEGLNLASQILSHGVDIQKNIAFINDCTRLAQKIKNTPQFVSVITT
jgi:hypothetical protein